MQGVNCTVHCGKAVGDMRTVFSTGQYSFIAPDDPFYKQAYSLLQDMKPQYFRSHNHYNDEAVDSSGLDDFQLVEPRPPGPGGCCWDFTGLDQKLADELAVCDRDTFVYNIRTCPPWMLRPGTSAPLFPVTSGQVRDESYGELADFCARVVGWYNKGGFYDECGKYHHSGHYYGIRYWELLNEQDAGESAIFIAKGKEYAKAFDAISKAIRAVDPDVKLGGPAQSCVPTEAHDLSYIEQFLANATQPVDFVSLHYYSDQSGLLTPAGTKRLTAAPLAADRAQLYFASIADISRYLRGAVALARRFGCECVMLSEANVSLDETFDEPWRSGAFSQGSYGAAWFGSLFAHAAQAGVSVVQQYQFYSPAARSMHLKNSLSYVDNQTGRPHLTYLLAVAIQAWFPTGGRILETDNGNGPELFAVEYENPGCIRILVANKAAARTGAVRLTLHMDGPGKYECAGLRAFGFETEVKWDAAQSNGFSFELHGYGVFLVELRQAGT